MSTTILLLLLYFLPSLIAAQRKHPNWAAIFVLDLLLGWTAIGWLVSLVWAFTKPRAVPPPAPPVTIINNVAVSGNGAILRGGEIPLALTNGHSRSSGLLLDQLEKLGNLRDRGVLSGEEFDEQKASLLGRPRAAAAIAPEPVFRPAYRPRNLNAPRGLPKPNLVYEASVTKVEPGPLETPAPSLLEMS